MNYEEFKELFTVWVKDYQTILGACIIGSYARNEQTEESDVDVMILCSNPDKFISDTKWVNFFGSINKMKIENWVNLQTVRVYYKNSLEIEFNFTRPEWASLPVDEDTYKIVKNGITILYDPNSTFRTLIEEIM